MVRVAEVCLVLAVLALVLGQVLGQPVVLGFVTTGSMAPTLGAGDGFVAVPTAVDGSVEPGDVVVFRAEEVQGGGLVTHRVVRETDRGFVTKGDANAFTDQDNDEPPVKREQIVAKALRVNGDVVVIPNLGAAVEWTTSLLTTVQRRLAALLGTRSLLGARGLAYLFFAGALLWYAVAEWRVQNAKGRARETSRTTGLDSRLVVGAFAGLLVLGATAAMVVPAGPQEYGFVSAESGADRPDVVRIGESKNRTHAVGNGGLIPVLVYLDTSDERIEVDRDRLAVGPRSVANATVTLHAPPRTGYYRRFVVEHRYLALLPQSVTGALYRLHPWAPVIAIDALLGVPFYLGGMALVGRGRVRDRSRDGLGPLRRLRR